MTFLQYSYFHNNDDDNDDTEIHRGEASSFHQNIMASSVSFPNKIEWFSKINYNSE